MKLKHVCSIAVDGAEEVQRTHATFLRLQSRHDLHSSRGELTFTLRLPRDLPKWSSLVQSTTRQACCVTDTRLVEVSIELVKKDESHFQEIQHALSTTSSLFDDGYMNIDMTGVVSQDVAPCLVHFKKSLHGQVTVDASSLLVG
jgi:hypothetical protein